LPVNKGRCATMTHDYKRHGTTTLFAALNVLEGRIIGRCTQRHRHQEFIRFLNTIEADIPAGKIIHVVLDNDATHKHAQVRAYIIFQLTTVSVSRQMLAEIVSLIGPLCAPPAPVRVAARSQDE
jgi:hypothetical protein